MSTLSGFPCIKIRSNQSPKKPKLAGNHPSPTLGARVPHAGLPATMGASSLHHHHLLLLVAVIAAVVLPPEATAEGMTEAEALIHLKKSFSNSSSVSSWLITNNDGGKSPYAPGSHEWHGVVCSRGKVTSASTGSSSAAPSTSKRSPASPTSAPSPSPATTSPARSPASTASPRSSSCTSPTTSSPAASTKSSSPTSTTSRSSGSTPTSSRVPSRRPSSRLRRSSSSTSSATPSLGSSLPRRPRRSSPSTSPTTTSTASSRKRSGCSTPARSAGTSTLCYPPTPGQLCKRPEVTPPPGSSSFHGMIMGLAAVLVSGVVLAVALCACCGGGGRVRDYDPANKGDTEDTPPVYMVKQGSSSTQRRSTSWLRRRSGSSAGGRHRRSSSAAKADDGSTGGSGDLVIVNDCKGVFGLTDLMKAAAQVIGGGGGSAYKAVMASGVSVVVKHARDMNRGTRDAFEAEMKRLRAGDQEAVRGGDGQGVAADGSSDGISR